MDEPLVREVIRWTARLSLVLFCFAFGGERRLAKASRRNALRGLAGSHIVHGIAILALAWITGGRNLAERADPLTVIGGAVGYLAILYAGWRPETRLTSLGLFWVWGVFLVSYGGRAVRMPVPYVLPVMMLVLAMTARLTKVPDRVGQPDPSW